MFSTLAGKGLNVKEILFLSEFNACRIFSKQLLQIIENLCGPLKPMSTSS